MKATTDPDLRSVPLKYRVWWHVRMTSHHVRWFFRGYYRSRLKSLFWFKRCDKPTDQCRDYGVDEWEHFHPRWGR